MEIVETDQPTESGTQPEKIYDLSKGEFVDNPALKKEDKPEEKEEDEEEESEVKETEEEDNDEEEKPESEEEEPEEEEKETEEKPDEAIEPDAYIAQVYGEKYNIKTEADLTKMIDNALDVMDELQQVKAERDALKSESGKPKFTSEKQQKAFEFLSQFDIDRQGEALDTYAKLLGMDIDNTDPRLLLEEQFVHQHPEWTRQEAQRMFQKEYTKKYTLKRESFDGTDEEFKSEVEDMKIMEKGDVARAKAYLKEQKQKYKPSEKSEPKSNEAVSEAVKKNAKEYSAYIEKANEISFEDGDDKYVYKLDAEEKKQVSETMLAWVNNPSSYNEKGELIGASTPEEMYHTVVGGLFLKKIINAVKTQVNNKVSTKRVEEIAEKQPKKRQSPSSGEAKTDKDNLDEQAIQLIKKRKAA